MKFALPTKKNTNFTPLLIVVLFWFKEWFSTIHSLAHVFSCEFCEVSKSTFFHTTPPVDASKLLDEKTPRLFVGYSLGNI